MDIHPGIYGLICLAFAGLSGWMMTKSKFDILYVATTVILFLIACVHLGSMDGYNKRYKCLELAQAGYKTIYTGRCYVEIKDGLYQNIGGKYTHVYLKDDLINNIDKEQQKKIDDMFNKFYSSK